MISRTFSAKNPFLEEVTKFQVVRILWKIASSRNSPSLETALQIALNTHLNLTLINRLLEMFRRDFFFQTR